MTNKKSEIYWRDRIAEEIRFKTIQDKSILAVYDQLYRQHWDAIEKEIQAFYQRYGDKHGLDPAKVKERVSEMDVRAFESKAKQYVREKDFSDRANEELALYNLKMKVSRGELLQYYLDLEMVALTDGEHKLTERFLSDEYVSELQRQAGILGQSVPSPQAIKEQTQTIINIPFHGATWSARIWDRQDQLRVIVQRFVEKALYRGWSPLRLIPQLRKEFKASVYEAKRLAITELARVQTEAQKQAYLNSGFDRYIYMAEPSACRICADLDGKVEKVSEMTPGHNAAPMHPHCRCSTAPYAEREELERMFGGDSLSDIQNAVDNISLATASYRDIINLGERIENVYKISEKIGDKEQLKETFGQIRQMGGRPKKADYAKRASRVVKQGLEEAFDHLPSDWSEIPSKMNRQLYIRKSSKRGYFAGGAVKPSGRYDINQPNFFDGYLTIVTDGERETTPYHEIGHMVEFYDQDIVRLSKDWIASRTAGEKPVKLKEIFKNFNYRDDEITKKDDFISPYIGKEYPNATEVFSMGIESLYVPSIGKLKRIDSQGKPEFKYITDDPEYLNLIIGLLVTGGR